MHEPYQHIRHHIKALATVICIFIALVLADKLLGQVKAVIVPTVIEAPKIISRKEIIRGDPSKLQVIFTFDGGAGADSTEAILAALAKHNVKGTFFLTGKFVEKYPDIVKRIAAGGHEIFSHTYDHPHLPTISDAAISEELGKMDQALQAVTGSSSKPYFRAPYGDRDARVLDEAFRDGYESVYWTDDARDWEEPKGMTADEVKARILSHVSPGNIYLMHLGDTITGAILDDVFTAIESRGYKIVSLTQGL